MKNIIFSFVATLLLTSCMSIGNPAVRDANLTNRIQRGATTKAQIVQMLGEPQVRTKQGYGLEKWQYNYTTSEIDGATFIPIYGIFAGGGKSDASILEVEFTEYGVVKNFTTTESNFKFKNFGN